MNSDVGIVVDVKKKKMTVGVWVGGKFVGMTNHSFDWIGIE